MFITIEKIFNSSNTIIKSNILKLNKSINLDKKIGYLSICENYIYCKTIDKSNIEKTIRYDISDPLNPLKDNEFLIDYQIASHNMYFFKDKNNIIKSIGGQHLSQDSYKDIVNNQEYQKYEEYHKNITFIYGKPFNITMSGCDYIYNHALPCPYYANGLHLFELEKNNNLKCLNNDLPILSGIHPGRYDGHYGYTNNKDLNSCRNGLTVYDSMGSVIYNKETDLYFLYHRANIGTGRRSIQYTTSKDLLEWSEYNIVNFNDDHDYFSCNMYYSNFFNIPNTNIYLAILPYIKRISNEYNSIDKYEYYKLYYSYDCINYKFIGNIHINNSILTLEDNSCSSNLPYNNNNNNMYFYIANSLNNILDIYTMEFNRYFYITNNKNEEGLFNIKLNNYNENLILNVEVELNGYILIELYNQNNLIIEGYSFNDCKNITNINIFSYKVEWNTINKIPYDIQYLKIKILNAKIYSIE